MPGTEAQRLAAANASAKAAANKRWLRLARNAQELFAAGWRITDAGVVEPSPVGASRPGGR